MVVESLDWRHTSNLWQGRFTWLESKMKGSADYALSIDSDTNFDAVMMREALRTADKTLTDVAMFIAPVVQGDGRSNLRHRTGHVMTDSEHACHSHTFAEIGAGGAAISLFNLDVLRRIWTDGVRPTLGPWSTATEQWRGEDIALCHEIGVRGGKIYSLPVKTTHYVAVQ